MYVHSLMLERDRETKRETERHHEDSSLVRTANVDCHGRMNDRSMSGGLHKAGECDKSQENQTCLWNQFVLISRTDNQYLL